MSLTMDIPMMPMIKTIVDEGTYKRLVRDRKAAGLPSVSALFLKKCGVLDEETEAAEIVRSALKTAKRKSSGCQFRLRDLFPRERWESFSRGARLRAGRMFNAEMAAAVDGIRIGPKTASNHQTYVVA